MLVKDIMTKEIVSVKKEAKVREIVETMLKNRIGTLPVVEKGNKLVGIITRGDLILREKSLLPKSRWAAWFSDPVAAAEDYVKTHGVTAEEIMTKKVVTVDEKTPVEEVAALMVERNLNYLPVLRRDKVIGIVSKRDMLKAVARLFPRFPKRAKKTDRQITKDVETMIAKGGFASPRMILVSAAKGIVTLRGVVDNEAQVRAAQVAAENVPGVKRVVNELTVRSKIPGYV